MTISFPINVEALKEWMPHRPPAICVDEVTWANAEEGICRTHIKSGKPNPLLAVDALAQAFGYVSACQIQMGLIPPRPKAQETYLVGLKNFSFFERGANDWILHVRRTRHFEPLVYVQGKVTTPHEEVVAEGELRLYSGDSIRNSTREER